jgi:molybdopterin converting factor small subunit
MRGTAEFLSGLTATRGMEDDVDEARLQLRQALGHCAQDREELDRLRKMLQQEREAAQAREQEIEQVEAANSEEIHRLNEVLRKAEQARREAEVKLHPLQQREADLAEELNRQKEKERLRKEYIEELKKRHEEDKQRLEQLHLREQAGRREDQVARLTAEGLLSKLQHELARIRDFEAQRSEREREYVARVNSEAARLREGCGGVEQLRELSRDVEQKMLRHFSGFYSAAPYEPPREDEQDPEDLFLG